MIKMQWLYVFSSILLSVITWLNDNFVRVMIQLKSHCENTTKEWLAEQIVTTAIEGAFR